MALKFDRDRARAFGRFVWRRFVDDKCFETAGALSYTTLFALVPLMAAVFGILAVLPAFSGMSLRLQDFVFSNFVPAAGRAVQHYLMQFAGNASRLTTLGIIVFLLSALAMLASIEERFNRIWRVAVRRSAVSRFLMYWAALTLGPLLIVAGLAVTSYLTALPLIAPVDTDWSLVRRVWAVFPFVVTWLGLFALYMLVPNRRVPWKHAVGGALLSTVLFEFAKWAFTAYVSNVPSYQQIYGQLAVIPIFLVWIYLSWTIVLLGASITASLSSFEYRPRAWRLPVGGEFLGLMHLLKHLVGAQRDGGGISEEDLLHCERFMTDDLLERYLRDLQREKLVHCTDDDQWMVIRNLDEVTLGRLYEGGGYRMPTDPDLLRTLGDGLPPILLSALTDLSVDLHHAMDRTLREVFLSADTGSAAAKHSRSMSA